MRKNRQTAKYYIKSYIIAGSLAGAISMALALPVPVMAAQQSLASVTGQAQIQPMGDGSGKYMMKSDGFYCLDVNGAGSTQAEIHYFQDYEIDGTVFDGYYYHDTDGKFKACSPHMEHLKGVAVFGDKTDEEADTQNVQEAEKFDGYYFVNNLGRLSAAPQVRYIDNLAIDGITLNGYYYFDENGRLVTEPGIHSLEMDCYEMNFDGSYYFGGTNGALLQEIFEATGSALRSANQAELAKQMSNPSLTVATVALATVLAPLFEECIFRLIPFTCFAWLTETDQRAKTIMLIATSAFFACMHVSPMVNSWLVYFAVGMIFGIAYLKGGFVGSSLAHFSYNMFAVLMSVNLTH